MAWSTETIIALITLIVTCPPLLIVILSYVKRKLRRRLPATDLLPLHRLPRHAASRTLTENDMSIPGLLIKLNPFERSIDMQIFISQNNPTPAATTAPSSDNLETSFRRLTTGFSSTSS